MDITNIYKTIYNPVWVFVVFQSNRSNSQLKENSIFNHVIVKNIWIEIDKIRYPKEFLDLDWDNNNYVLVYDAFQDFKNTYFKTDSIPFVD